METSPYRALAASVLMRAIKDAYSRSPQEVREEALAFLRPHNPVLATYCDDLDLDPVAFCTAVHENGPQWVKSKRIKKHLAAS